LKVDIVHLSPPRQYYSVPHTILGFDDENNKTQIFFTDALLRKARSCIAVLEETAGLVVLKKHNDAFNKLWLSFADSGYSLSWQIVPFQDLDLPQNREKLVIIASW
jgi:DNA (cytosine-5)-methyltransferase 1